MIVKFTPLPSLKNELRQMVKESRKRQRLGAKIHMEYSLLRIIYVSGVKANGMDRDTRGVP